MFEYLSIALKIYMDKITTETKQQSNYPNDKFAKTN